MKRNQKMFHREFYRWLALFRKRKKKKIPELWREPIWI